MTSVAIMQPTYLPWIGYFAMIDRVDSFIVLDSVQFARRSWQQRNRIKLNGREHLLTVPVLSKGRRDQLILDVEIDRSRDFPRQHVATIRRAYAKAPFFAEHVDSLFRILDVNHRYLADLNAALISWLAMAFGITTPIARSSTFAAVGKRANLLTELCLEAGAGVYVSAPGSAGYIDESSSFAERGISVAYHRYDHPTYPQGGSPFLPFMGAIDLLFHAGPDGLAILRSGIAA